MTLNVADYAERIIAVARAIDEATLHSDRPAEAELLRREMAELVSDHAMVRLFASAFVLLLDITLDDRSAAPLATQLVELSAAIDEANADPSRFDEAAALEREFAELTADHWSMQLMARAFLLVLDVFLDTPKAA